MTLPDSIFDPHDPKKPTTFRHNVAKHLGEHWLKMEPKEWLEHLHKAAHQRPDADPGLSKGRDLKSQLHNEIRLHQANPGLYVPSETGQPHEHGRHAISVAIAATDGRVAGFFPKQSSKHFDPSAAYVSGEWKSPIEGRDAKQDTLDALHHRHPGHTFVIEPTPKNVLYKPGDKNDSGPGPHYTITARLKEQPQHTGRVGEAVAEAVDAYLTAKHRFESLNDPDVLGPLRGVNARDLDRPERHERHRDHRWRLV